VRPMVLRREVRSTKPIRCAAVSTSCQRQPAARAAGRRIGTVLSNSASCSVTCVTLWVEHTHFAFYPCLHFGVDFGGAEAFGRDQRADGYGNHAWFLQDGASG